MQQMLSHSIQPEAVRHGQIEQTIRRQCIANATQGPKQVNTQVLKYFGEHNAAILAAKLASSLFYIGSDHSDAQRGFDAGKTGRVNIHRGDFDTWIRPLEREFEQVGRTADIEVSATWIMPSQETCIPVAPTGMAASVLFGPVSFLLAPKLGNCRTNSIASSLSARHVSTGIGKIRWYSYGHAD